MLDLSQSFCEEQVDRRAACQGQAAACGVHAYSCIDLFSSQVGGVDRSQGGHLIS